MCRRVPLMLLRRNRRASDYLQAYQRDGQTPEASSSSVAWLFSCAEPFFQERMAQVPSTAEVKSAYTREGSYEEYLPHRTFLYLRIDRCSRLIYTLH